MMRGKSMADAVAILACSRLTLFFATCYKQQFGSPGLRISVGPGTSAESGPTLGVLLAFCGRDGRRGQASEHHSSGSAGSGTATSPVSDDGCRCSFNSKTELLKVCSGGIYADLASRGLCDGPIAPNFPGIQTAELPPSDGGCVRAAVPTRSNGARPGSR